MKVNIKQSTCIKAAFYAPTTEILTVEFQSGHLYEYLQVPASVVQQWVVCSALPKGSVGSQFSGLIKSVYSYKKI